MKTFPAQYSTLAASALKEHIEEVYGFRGLTCRLLVHNVSDTYILESEQAKYIFKVYRKDYRTLNEIKGEVELLNILKDNSIPVSYPLTDLAGKQIQYFKAIEGMRYGVLFTFATGKVVLNPDDEQLKIIGRTMALMHHATSTCKLKHERIIYDIYSTVRGPLKLIRSRFEDLSQEYTYLQDLGAKVVAKLDEYDLTRFSYGYCHYDLLPKNFHFDDDNNITIFDFDWAGKALLVNDVMTFMVQLFFMARHQMITKEEADHKLKILIEAYRENRSLSDPEIELIPYLGIMYWIHAFGFYEANYDDFAITFFTPRFIKERVELIKVWVEWYCKF
ncbi:phosphotransferase [Mucilaginibacter jinjuensis]|uniref:Phosphotransferase n=1 Tax=Mucilaginibacter jinjuensis TaxID=1176721 RepID=A0ABY7T5A3_9SPHI|nr:phosphotransferase [Mucilaginibacter jinjuensis]WCT11630.1 phosphotransferase [Mucilaginibacter jinjuensis]